MLFHSFLDSTSNSRLVATKKLNSLTIGRSGCVFIIKTCFPDNPQHSLRSATLVFPSASPERELRGKSTRVTKVNIRKESPNSTNSTSGWVRVEDSKGGVEELEILYHCNHMTFKFIEGAGRETDGINFGPITFFVWNWKRIWCHRHRQLTELERWRKNSKFTHNLIISLIDIPGEQKTKTNREEKYEIESEDNHLNWNDGFICSFQGIIFRRIF